MEQEKPGTIIFQLIHIEVQGKNNTVWTIKANAESNFNLYITCTTGYDTRGVHDIKDAAAAFKEVKRLIKTTDDD